MVLLSIIVGILTAVVVYLLLARSRSKQVTINPHDFIAKINYAIGEENQTLKEENELLGRKNLFFSDWFIRSFIEWHHRKNLALGDERLYTSDALEELRKYAKDALDNFEKTWNSQFYNEQCKWVKEYLDELIQKIDSFLDENFDGDILDLDNENAFKRFFVGVETCMFYDKSAKKSGREETKLSYWKPQRGFGDES